MLSALVLVLFACAVRAGEQWDVPDFYFSGISTFAHLPHDRCLVNDAAEFDVAVLGIPIDTAVSYRPGARFGPRGIRAGSARQTVFRSFNPVLGINPYVSSTKFLDCGDVPVTPFDNAMALEQIEKAYDDITSHPVPTGPGTIDALPPKLVDGQKVFMAKDGKTHPRVAVMGGDHSVALPILRSLYKLYGPVSVIHFDSHLDTWAPAAYGDAAKASEISGFTHGTMFFHAASEGLIRNTSMHVGLRGALSGTDYVDYRRDAGLGFTYLETWEVDRLGVEGTAAAIRERVQDTPVYISIDMCVESLTQRRIGPLDCARHSTSRELRSIVRQLQDLRLVGCEVVEVSPPYDSQGEVTSLAAAELLYELMSIMALHPLDKVALSPHERPARPAVRTPSDATRPAPPSRWEAFEAGARQLYTHVLVPSIRIVGALALLAVLTVVLQSCAKQVLT